MLLATELRLFGSIHPRPPQEDPQQRPMRSSSNGRIRMNEPLIPLYIYCQFYDQIYKHSKEELFYCAGSYN